MPCRDAPKPSPEVQQRLEKLILTNEQLVRYKELLLENLERGLAKETHPNAVVKCFVTYVQNLPTGEERGNFLALDLGGSHFRVLLVKLQGNDYSLQSNVYDIPEEVMTGPGTELFDYIGECMAKFMKAKGIQSEILPLGFTFSFPLQQIKLTKGILVRWTKGFDCEGVVGNDVVQMLQDAINRRGDIQVAVTAILNDTTGTLMSCAVKNKTCAIGLIVGTGSNACYWEEQENAQMFDDVDLGSGHVIINTEFGAFGEDGCLDYIRTEFDKQVDAESLRPGAQINEKLVAGMYLGEIVRVAAVTLTKEGILFSSRLSQPLNTPDSIPSDELSNIERDPIGTYDATRSLFKNLKICGANEQDCIDFRFLVECVTKRSAHCLSAAMATFMEKMGQQFVTIGIDGSVYKFHPYYHCYMVDKIKELVNPNIEFEIMLSEDGSGIGAAIVAAVAASGWSQTAEHSVQKKRCAALS